MASFWAAAWAASLLFFCFVVVPRRTCSPNYLAMPEVALAPAVNATPIPPPVGLIEVMRPAAREAVARELVRRNIEVVALVFYGRRESVSILNSYLEVRPTPRPPEESKAADRERGDRGT